MFGTGLRPGRSESVESIRISPFIGLKTDLKSLVRATSRTVRSFLVLRSVGASPKRFRAGHRTRSPSPLSPAGFFRVGRRRPFPWLPSARTPSWRPSFGFSAIVLPTVPVIAVGSEPHGEGLGGGYCTPPNRTRRERSELVLGGSGGYFDPRFAASQQSYPQAFSRARGLGKD